MIKTTTVRLPSDTLIQIKAIAAEKGRSQNNIINDLIEKGLKTIGKNKGEIKARKINHKMPYYDPEKNLILKDL
ncbi:MAG: ribbon-helix-helix domain-containing protein [Methanobrevibacter sp.]|jgi:predicted DNA-binding protein|nr:ribbon-helix-helix domain-containing protein [Candidatus Methanovirga aequatorialis]